MHTPKPQTYPIRKIRVGAVLYSYLCWTDDQGKASAECREWIVRSIQARRGTAVSGAMAVHLRNTGHTPLKYVNITEKIDKLTWGKRSKKHCDFGFLHTIPAVHRKQFRVGADLPFGIYTDQAAALLWEIHSVGEDIKLLMLEVDKDGNDESKQELHESRGHLAALLRKQTLLIPKSGQSNAKKKL